MFSALPQYIFPHFFQISFPFRSFNCTPSPSEEVYPVNESILIKQLVGRNCNRLSINLPPFCFPVRECAPCPGTLCALLDTDTVVVAWSSHPLLPAFSVSQKMMLCCPHPVPSGWVPALLQLVVLLLCMVCLSTVHEQSDTGRNPTFVTIRGFPWICCQH